MTLTGNVGNLHRMHNVTSHRFFLRTRVDTICEAERNTSCLFVLLSVSFLLGSMLISLFGYIVFVFFKKHFFFPTRVGAGNTEWHKNIFKVFKY